MTRFDRIMRNVLAGLGVLLAAVGLWATLRTRPHAQTQTDVLYLAAAPADETQVWQLDWTTRRTQLVAQLPGFVLEYPAFPHMGRVVYSVEREDGGHDLWLVDIQSQRAHRWLDCAPDDCSAVSPMPDGRGIVYTRSVAGVPALWQRLYDADEATPLFTEATAPRHYAAWSPAGLQLAYVDPTGQVCIAPFQGSTALLCIPATMEATPVWSPDGTTLLVTDMRLETGFANHILSVDVVSGDYVDLSNSFGIEDDAPVWSPDGRWIAFRRKPAGTALGKQVWVMRADGSDARALTPDTDAYYGPPVWLSDGETLLVPRHIAGGSALWAISAVSATATLVIANGYLPQNISSLKP